MSSPENEQEICVTCGFCCDGTLFSTATLKPGEKGNLPEKMEEAYGKNGEYEFFKLPCAYFCEKCTIYDQKKANVCSSFRCKLLKDVAKNEVSQEQALGIVENAMQMRQEVFKLYAAIFHVAHAPHFRQILTSIGDKEEANDPIALTKEFQLLKIKATILETLLIKQFKSEDIFEKMIEQKSGHVKKDEQL